MIMQRLIIAAAGGITLLLAAPLFTESRLIEIKADKATVGSAEQVTLTWRTEESQSCNASNNGNVKEWTGNVGLTGTKVVGPLSKDTTFVLKCRGSLEDTMERGDVVVSPSIGDRFRSYISSTVRTSDASVLVKVIPGQVPAGVAGPEVTISSGTPGGPNMATPINIRPGTKDVVLGKVKFSAGPGEDISIKRLSLSIRFGDLIKGERLSTYYVGRALRIYDEATGALVYTAVFRDQYETLYDGMRPGGGNQAFTLPSPVIIPKGGSKTFILKADIASEPTSGPKKLEGRIYSASVNGFWLQTNVNVATKDVNCTPDSTYVDNRGCIVGAQSNKPAKETVALGSANSGSRADLQTKLYYKISSTATPGSISGDIGSPVVRLYSTNALAANGAAVALEAGDSYGYAWSVEALPGVSEANVATACKITADQASSALASLAGTGAGTAPVYTTSRNLPVEIKCTDSTGKVHTGYVTYSVNGRVDLKVNSKDSGVTVRNGQTAALSWKLNPALGVTASSVSTACTITDDFFDRSKKVPLSSVSGTKNVGPLSITSSSNWRISLSCKDSAGVDHSDSVSVTLTP